MGMIGRDADQVPTNGMLGGMAYADPGATAFTGPFQPRYLALADLVAYPAADWPWCCLIVTNASGGAALCVSNGTAWISQRTGSAVA